MDVTPCAVSVRAIHALWLIVYGVEANA
jgi:hypothetical protein